MSEQSYGWLSLVPPLAAILLAIATRRVLVSLATGIYVGALLLAGGNPFVAVASTLETHLWASLSDPDHLRVFVFTLLMGAMVGVMRYSGGMEGIVRLLAPLARTRRRGQLTVWLLGLVIFFDDYANSLLLGHTMQPLTDRLRISREKLAYLVDSTAAPVAGLALVSTWVAGEIGFIRAGLESVELAEPVDGFEIFIETIPYRFYVLWALFFVPLVGLLGRDLWSMQPAESRAMQRGQGRAEEVKAAVPAPAAGDWANAIFPIVAVVGVTLAVILLTGARAMMARGEGEPNWLNIFGNGDSYMALVYGSLVGLAVAFVLATLKGVLTRSEAQAAATRGARQVTMALAILWLAWALSGLTGQEYLNTGAYLAGLLRGNFDVRWMPTAVFILASFVAFATGTSWGTMGILMPLVVSVTFQMLGDQTSEVSPHDPVVLAAIGSVLAGAIFGDHCSPISDTTVLSSQASGCDHIAHVRTQLPYALLVGTVSIVCGTFPVGFGVPVGWLVPLGCVVLVISLLVFGRAPIAESSEVNGPGQGSG